MLSVAVNTLKSISKSAVKHTSSANGRKKEAKRLTQCMPVKRSYFRGSEVCVKATGAAGTTFVPRRSSTTSTTPIDTPSNEVFDDLELTNSDGKDLFEMSLKPHRTLPLNMHVTLVRISRTSPQGFFTSRDRNLARAQGNVPGEISTSSTVKGAVDLPLSQHDLEVLKKKSASKSKQVPLEIDPEYKKSISPTYAEHLMPLTGQYTSSESATSELGALSEVYGPNLSAQLDLETQAVNLEICRSMSSKDNVTSLGRGSEMGPARTLVRQWYPHMVTALKQKIAHEQTRRKTTQLANALNQLRPEILSAITLHAAIGNTLSHPDGTQFAQLAAAIADTAHAQINYELLKGHNSKYLESKFGPHAVYSQQLIQKLSKKMLQTPAEPQPSDRELKEDIIASAARIHDGFSSTTVGTEANDTPMNRLAASDAADYPHRQNDGSPRKKYPSPSELGAPFQVNWTRQLKQDVGRFLLHTLVEVATFTHVTENGVKHEKQAFEVEVPKSTATGVASIKNIRLASAIMENISYEHVLQEANHIRHYPMLIPPRPWKGPEDGGYFLYPASVLRYYNYEQQMRPLYENHDQLSLLYESLTVLGETSWRINKDVYNVIKQAWSEGGAVADIPSRADLPLPVPGPEGKSPQWYRQIQRIQTENYNKNSLRCDLLLKLGVAEKFSEDVLYFPHNMDFRGRVYPIPPHLNHMGSDLCRGLLTFSEGMPLGARGLYWLKIQLANLYGQDKIPFEQRVKWAEEHFPEVEDSATRPLRGRRWWLKAEDPWQCLACCFELHRALKHPEGPEKYVSSLPIHQDGTCNGLQHYAALGGDEQGARSVNLLPADRPQDVYADVAALVQARIAQDAANDVEIAKLLKGQVNRRIIKQTVMTSVYGVTFVGARQQIANALKDRGVLSEDTRYQASVYLARATFDSIGEMFTGARSIMDWFATCASLVAKRNRLVTWTTPLGLPVAQPYKKISRKNIIKTAFQTVTLENEASGPVNSLRQRSAFPPNFVHSLDSSHMLLTALACKRKGITFSSVHDSYWAHACNVDKMNVELREAFVELHRRPLLQRLYDQFAKDNPDISFPPVPERGSFDLDLVKQSPYFFN